MRIFGKHVFRSIKKEPLQPIMIIAVVMIAVAVIILSVSLPINIYRNERAGMGIDEWTPDLTVTLKSSANERLIFEDEVAAALGDRGSVIGEFSITGFADHTEDDGEETSVQIDISALNLERADSFYDIRYLEYGKFTNNNIKTAAIIDEPFAEWFDLELGDTITVNVLGEEFTYTVQAIAKETGIFNKRDFLVDISGVRKTLAKRSSLIASLSDKFDPYTRVDIKVKDKADIAAVKAELEAIASFANKKISEPSDSSGEDYLSTILTISIVMPALLLVVVAAMMLVSTFELLQKKRAQDVALFKIVGADSGHMNTLLYIESLIYALTGGILGCAFSALGIFGLNKLYDFSRVRMRFGIFELLVGMGSAVLFTLFCTAMHIRKQKKKTLQAELSAGNFDTDRAFSLKKLLYGIPAALLVLIAVLLPAKQRYIPLFAFIMTFVVFIYVVSPYVVGGIASLICALLERTKRGAGDFILAAKSCRNSYPLRHAGRVTAILVTVFISLSVVLSAVDAQLVDYVSFASFDYIGMQVDDETKRMVNDLDFVEATAESVVNRNVVLTDGISTTGIAVSGNRDECFNDTILPSKMPVGDEITLSKGVAGMLELEVGDRIDCVIADIPCTLTLVEVVNTYGDFAFYDADYIGADLDMFCIKTDGSADAKEQLVALFDERGLEFLDKDAFFAQSHKRIQPQLAIFRIMFAIMILMTFLGIFNILSDQRMARLREFEILKLNGKTKRGIVCLQAVEISYLAVSALIVALVSATAICAALNNAAMSFGMALYF